MRVTTADHAEVGALGPPFALIARINSASAGTAGFSIKVDGSLICEREVAGGGARRVDCAVEQRWDPTIVHDVTIEGPPTAWTLDYLELATHHGNTDGAHFLMILPAFSHRYVRPGAGCVVAVWLALFAALLFPTAPRRLPRWSRHLQWVVAGAIALELAFIQCSQWVSPYRVVLSADTFARLLLLLFALRVWVALRWSAHSLAAYAKAPPVDRRTGELAVALVALCLIGMTAWQLVLKRPFEQIQRQWEQMRATQARVRLLAELQPVKLANCTFERFGEPHDGGYVLCANLLGSASSGYSYGISGYDQWGCDLSRRLALPVHQYDCFNLTRPDCPRGRTVFHEECVAGAPATNEGRRFDTLQHQFEKNGDGAGRVVVKMDVEGAEWNTLLRAPDAVLRQIDQMAIELHSTGEDQRTIDVVMKLKRHFYVASLHFNNMSCQEGIAPLPANAYEVLFVSRRLGVPGGAGRGGPPSGLLTPNVVERRDCQAPGR